MALLMKSSLFLPLLLVSQSVFSAVSSLTPVKGHDLLNAQEVTASYTDKKALVVVFLSAVCPCSDSHIPELKALAKEYPDFRFVGVHSNTDESKEVTQTYFKQAHLPFPVVQDNSAKIADAFKALKTPHAFVITPDGKTAYKGGVSDSHDFESSKRKLLREALHDLQNNQPIKTADGRTLGCSISRGDKYVW